MHKPSWGLHRLGHFAARAPWAALAIVAAISVLAVSGMSRIQPYSHSLDALFRSDTPEYERYERMRETFPLNGRDLILVAVSDRPFQRSEIVTLRDLHLELQLLDETDGVLSLFSIRGEPDRSGYAAPVIPDDVPEGTAFEELMARVAAHPFVAGKLLTATPEAGQAAVVVLGMSAEAVSTANLVPSIEAVSDAVAAILSGTGLRYELLGVPLMQKDVRLASRSDRRFFNIVGFAIGCLMCLLFFRQVRLVAIATVCPAIAVLWAFGVFGIVGFPFSFFMNAVPPLVMVIAFADAMHLTYGVRRRLREGDDIGEAVRRTVETVAPACLLTTLTTAVALLSLTMSESEVIRHFGLGGAIAVMLIFVVSMLVVPSLSMLLLAGREAPVRSTADAWTTDGGLDRVCDWLARVVPRRRRSLATIGIAVTIACGVLHLNLEPRFRLSEQMPGDLRQRIEAAERDAGLAASSPVYVVIRHPPGEAATGGRLRAVVGGVHEALAGEDTIGSIWSLALVDREIGEPDSAVLADYLDQLPPNLRDRLVNSEAGALLVTGHFPDLESRDMRAAVASVDAALQAVRAANPDLSIEITGISAVSALHATTMIADLNRSLLSAVFVVMVLLGVAFRSVFVPLMAFLPNVLPVVASGALLHLLNIGIDYAGIIGLTVAFGLAIDDTVHFLARFRHEQSAGRDTLESVMLAIRRIGPVMAITTVVLIFGVGVTIFGEMPQTRTFGAVVIVTLIAALIADLVFTPALILLVGSGWPRVGPIPVAKATARGGGMSALAFLALGSLALAAAVTSAGASPLTDSLRGKWSGSGSLVLASGATEAIRCRGYGRAPTENSVEQFFKCATTGSEFTFYTSLFFTGDRVRGEWKGAERSGTATGNAASGRLQLSLSSAQGSGSLDAAIDGCTQSLTVTGWSNELKSLTVRLQKPC